MTTNEKFNRCLEFFEEELIHGPETVRKFLKFFRTDCTDDVIVIASGQFTADIIDVYLKPNANI